MSNIDLESLTLLHYGRWDAALKWFVMFGFFIFFLPFHRKGGKKPNNIYIAFILASALEMYGIPLSLYFLAYFFGISMPVGLLWGHTLAGIFGLWGMYVGYALNLIGATLIILGWIAIFRRYWSKEAGKGELVTDGVYAYSRHPQYAGFILMTLGLLVHWATLPLLIMWPFLVFQYYRLARREEAEMVEEFGEEYQLYRERAPMFLPFPKLRYFRGKIEE